MREEFVHLFFFWPQVHGDIDLLFDEAAMVTQPLAGHADAEARRSVLTALPCANLVTGPFRVAGV